MTQRQTHFRACNLCEAICGLAIETDGEQIVSIRGDKQDPFSRGHICPKAVALQDLQEDPDRLRQPLRKVDGQWQSISWDEAFAYAAERLHSIASVHGGNSVAVYAGNPSVHNYGLMTHASYFYKQLQTRSRYSATSVDQLPHHLVSHLMYGHQMLIPVPDIDRCDFMLVLGGNPLASNGSIMTVPDVEKRLKAVKSRGRLVVVDPRRSETAELADQHVFIRPGEDAAFLLVFLRTLLDESLTTPSAVPFAELSAVKAALAPFDLAAQAQRCGVALDTIQTLAREFAATPRAACYGRMGVSTQVFGSLSQWLIQLINLVAGKLDAEGGMMFSEPAMDLLHSMSPGNFARWHSRVSQLPEFAGELPVAALAEEMLTPGEGQIRALITQAGNPVLSTPNGRQLDRALEGLEFMLSIDFYLNETTRHADLILPPTSALEHDHYDMSFNMLAVRNVTRYNAPVFAKPAGSLHDWEIFMGLAKAYAERAGHKAPTAIEPAQMVDMAIRMGAYGDKSSHKLTLKALQEQPHGIDLGPLKPCLAARLQTSNKQVETAPALLLQELQRFAHSKAPEGLLLIGRRHVRSNNSWMHNYHRLIKGKPRHQLLMHPDDLAPRGLVDGQRVRVSTRVGAVDVVVQASDEVMPGVVSLPHGFGHQREGVRMSKASELVGVSANDLTDEQLIDRLSGNTALNGVPVEVQACA
ncbi:molybdopterin oxidoreductase family protein [Atopomonas sediminilitoris]|uniref:molybdopterin oxidoreductase family protein n=1 Tax=Atopomonas sediminilitoris TaxID=2919919 RepID=UPI001F4E6E93|nr:molybdopterin oxidoreductase family protein [Atopomonas sediminilitoris]MCJ8168879.1 molybdopterin oxidoreductase family protein [Atopomonas sediminilitoris]